MQHRIVPNLWFDTEAEEAAAFYVSVFGGDSKVTKTTHYTEAGPREAGTVMTVEFALDGQRFIAINGGPQFTFDEAVSFQIDCETQAEVDRFWEALTHGGEESRCGWLKDRYGLSWQVVPTGWEEILGDPDPERGRRAMEAMFAMRKLDIAALRAAADGDVTPDRTRADPTGAALCLLSAAGFGAMAIFGKLAFDAGVSTLTLLVVRFALATLIFGVLLAARPSLAAGLRRAGGRVLAIGLGLGAIGYATQAGLFFAALQRLDASLLALVLYTYPAWVMLGSLALGREQPTRRRVLALALSSTGLVVLLAGASAGAVDAAGVALGVGASLAYTVYILVADHAGLDIPPLALTTLVCVGAMCTLGIAGAISGSLDLRLNAEAWLWLGLIAVVSTAVPIVAFFAGLARVGPSSAAILSSFEPVVTVALAYLAFSEVLSGVQLAGAALVLGAAVLLAAPARRSAPVPPDH